MENTATICKSILCVSLIITLFTVSINAQSQPVNPDIVIEASYFDVYGPIRELPILTEEEFQEMENEAYMERNESLRIRYYPYENIALPYGPDPVWQKEMGAIETVRELELNFDGQTSPYYPPDANGDAGLDYYFQVINTTYSIYDKSGNQIIAPTAFNTLFAGVPGSSYNNGDPIILYDEQADRWFAAEFSISGPNDYMLMAISETGDPTGLWYRWSFDVADLPDYPKFGIWRDGYYMTTNNSSAADVYVFEREAMIAGSSTPIGIGFDNPWRPTTIDGFHCIQPIDNDGTFAPIGSPGLFITINDDAIGGGSDQLWMYELDVDWATPSNSTFSRTQQINVSAFDSNFGSTWNNISQPGTSQRLDAIPMVLMYRAQYRNFGSSENIVCCHTVDVDGTNHAGVRWYELVKTSSAWSVRQQGTYAPDANSRWMASIAINDYHEICIGYSISSPSVYPGIRYCGQSFDENALASGTMDIAEVTLLTGSYSQTLYNRWGDYSLMVVDPSDDRSFWFTTEYIGTSGSRKTHISKFVFDTPTPVELTSFTSTVNSNSVNLKWETATEVDNYGFNIERSLCDTNAIKNWKKIGFVAGHGNSSSPKKYSFVDNDPVGGNKFQYRLKQIDTDGSYDYSEVIEAYITTSDYVLEQNYPNPFNPSTTIKFTLPVESRVKINVYNSLGQLVATLVDREMQSGYHEINFDGTGLASGVYLYQLQTGEFALIKKMLLLK